MKQTESQSVAMPGRRLRRKDTETDSIVKQEIEAKKWATGVCTKPERNLGPSSDASTL